MKIRELLTESRTGITHIEDLIFTDGQLGAQTAVGVLSDIAEKLSLGHTQVESVSVKWDGSPAIFAGIDPEDGKFFVGTKSAFAKKVPRRIKRPSDVNKFYGDEEQDDLRHKLLVAFNNLRRLEFNDVMQGDLMFTSQDLERATIDGDSYVVFRPNTITYAVPSDSKLANDILSKDLGIVWHTRWTGGPTLNDMVPSPAGRVALSKDPNIWQDDATYKNMTGIASLTAGEERKINNILGKAKALMRGLGWNSVLKVLNNKEFVNTIHPFINHRVRQGKHAGKPQGFIKEFLEFYKEKQLKGYESLGEPHQQKRMNKIQEMVEFVRLHQNEISGMVQLYDELNTAKLFLFKKLSRIDSVRTFKKTENGFEVTAPEGFVAVHDQGVVKLVDRLEFSRLNFLKSK